MDTQQQYRGQKSKLPTLLAGQFGYCTDSKELYIGTGGGNELMGAAAFKGRIEANETAIAANTNAISNKLTAVKAEAVGALAETAAQADVIAAFNSLIASLKAAGIMN